MKLIRKAIFLLPNGFLSQLFIVFLFFSLFFSSIWYFDFFGLLLKNEKILIKYFNIFIFSYILLIALLIGLFFINENVNFSQIISDHPIFYKFILILIFTIMLSFFFAFYPATGFKTLITAIFLIGFTISFFDLLAM